MMLLLKILLAATLLAAPETKWQRIKTNEQISFLLPNNPQILHRVTDGIPSTIYQTKDLACVAGVVCTNLSGKKITMTPEYAQTLYQEFKKETLSLETAVLKDEQTIPYENMLIKEIKYSLIKDKFEMTYFKRFIFRENYIYQISIGGRTRHINTILEAREMLFNSIKFEDSSKSENTKQPLSN